MRQQLFAVSSLILGGCSLLYNPNNLPPPAIADAAPDVEIILDADPSALAVEAAFPTALVEGTGTGGGAPHILVVHGTQLVAGATVAITAHDGTTDVSSVITVDNANLAVALDGLALAVPVTIAVDVAHAAAAPALALDISVTQPDGHGGTVTRTVPPATSPTLRYLDELTTGTTLATGVHDFSIVTLDVGAGTFTAADTGAPLVIRSRSSIAITGKLDVSATAANVPGPGGNAGGSGGLGGITGGDPGGGGLGAGGGLPSSAGGGFKLQGGDGDASNTGGPIAGTDAITTLAIAGSGGSGGHGGAVGAVGAVGGAGGGAVELTARGNLTVTGAVTANGGKGGTGGNKQGGGGSGGLILIRAGGTVALSTLTAQGGAGGGPSTGTGSVGRLRIDAVAPVTVTAIPAMPYSGPMFTMAPAITFERTPMVEVVGVPLASFSYFYVVEDGGIVGPSTKTLGTDGKARFPLAMDLARGLDHVCLVVEGATTQAPAEAMNCVDVAYLYKP